MRVVVIESLSTVLVVDESRYDGGEVRDAVKALDEAGIPAYEATVIETTEDDVESAAYMLIERAKESTCGKPLWAPRNRQRDPPCALPPGHTGAHKPKREGP